MVQATIDHQLNSIQLSIVLSIKEQIQLFSTSGIMIAGYSILLIVMFLFTLIFDSLLQDLTLFFSFVLVIVVYLLILLTFTFYDGFDETWGVPIRKRNYVFDLEKNHLTFRSQTLLYHPNEISIGVFGNKIRIFANAVHSMETDRIEFEPWVSRISNNDEIMSILESKLLRVIQEIKARHKD